MKTITVLVLAATIFMLSCNQTSNKEVKDAKENLTKAKDELNDAQATEKEAVKAKEKAAWNSFKNNADSSIATMENDLKKLEIKIEEPGKKDTQKLKSDYENAKADIVAMKEILHKKNVEFENDLKNFDKNVSEKNESFKREFKHDLDEFGKSFNDLFKDNVN